MSLANVGAFAASAATPGAASAALSTYTPTATFRACRDVSSVMFALPFEFYRTVTFTYVLVQQHWNPKPPSPDSSLAWTRSRYSPAAEKVAEAVTMAPCFGTGTRGWSKVTIPGPRN